MKIKSVLFVAALVLLFCSISYSQTDSVKNYTVKGVKVTIGKYYALVFGVKQAEKGKLIAVNKESILMLIDNELEEIELEDIVRIESMEANNVLYTANNSKIRKPIYSIGAGYAQRDNGSNDNYYYYNQSGSKKFDGFCVSGDALVRVNDNFGFRIDLGYLHTVGKTYSEGSYSNSYDSSIYSYETAYGSIDMFSLRTGLLFGAMSTEDLFNFYIYLGLGLGWSFRGEQIAYSYTTKNNITKTSTYYSGNRNNILIGAYIQIRLSYKISDKYGIFVEPNIQYWSEETYRVKGINGGITFYL